MHFTPLAPIVAARFLNMSSTTTSPTTSPTPVPVDGFPGTIGPFSFFGCVQSTNGFETFELASDTEEMSLDFCAASCPSLFMGVFDTTCYCGDELAPGEYEKVDVDMCDTSCPGDDEQFCGGVASGLAKRQSIPSSVLLTVYIRTSGEDSSGATTTETITSTTTNTVTACPSDNPDCPLGPTTGVTTITTTYCPEPTSDWHHKKIVCYSGYCAPEFPCDTCENHRVVCDSDLCWSEPCDDDTWDQLVICDGADCHYCVGEECHSKVICYDGVCEPESCYGDECEKKFHCDDEGCGHVPCDGDCYIKEVCEGWECDVVPPCDGSNCPIPPPPTTPAPTPIPSMTMPGTTPPAETLPPVGGSGKALPAVGITLFGAVAGLAFLF